MSHVSSEWNQSKTDFFWSEISSCDHVVQFYEKDSVLIDTLAGFVGGGINAGDCVILIATTPHLQLLQKRLKSFGIHISPLIEDDRLILLDATAALEYFMIDDMPDENRFNEFISGLLNRANCRNRRIRAFGEMVAVLWSQNKPEATMKLEELWNRLHHRNAFSLFCAYPKFQFNSNTETSLENICKCHTKILDGVKTSLTEVVYTDLN